MTWQDASLHLNKLSYVVCLIKIFMFYIFTCDQCSKILTSITIAAFEWQLVKTPKRSYVGQARVLFLLVTFRNKEFTQITCQSLVICHRKHTWFSATNFSPLTRLIDDCSVLWQSLGSCQRNVRSKCRVFGC